MRAVQILRTGGPEALAFSAAVAGPQRPPPPGHIIVRNAFAGVNFIDTYHRSGLYPVPLPYIPGREASGIVEAVGEGVSGFCAGDRIAHLGGSCYAEFSSVPAARAVQLPESVSLEVGGSLLLQGLTALSLARIAHPVKPNETVLVYAAAGGTGQALIQVCKHIGATVIGITSSQDKAELVRKAGADHVITYHNQDIVSRVMEITNGQGVHAIFDGVGKSSFDTSLACARTLGSLLSFGNASGKVDPIDIMKLVPKQVRLMRPSLFQLVADQETFDSLTKELIDLVVSNKYTIYIHKIYDLEDSASSHVDLEGGKTTGKLLIRI